MLKHAATYFPYMFPKAIKQAIVYRGEIDLTTHSKHLLTILTFLKKHSYTRFTLLTEQTAHQIPGKNLDFILTYQLLSTCYNTRIKVTSFINEKSTIESIVPLFKSANWFERELWDLFGIFYLNHPDLRRILTDYTFKGHPLKKNFPLFGYNEVIYSDTVRSIINIPVKLVQKN